MEDDGVTGNSAQAAGVWRELNSRPLLCASEPAGHPPLTHRAERRKLRAVRQLRARCGSCSSDFDFSRNVWGCGVEM